MSDLYLVKLATISMEFQCQT